MSSRSRSPFPGEVPAQGFPSSSLRGERWTRGARGGGSQESIFRRGCLSKTRLNWLFLGMLEISYRNVRLSRHANKLLGAPAWIFPLLRPRSAWAALGSIITVEAAAEVKPFLCISAVPREGTGWDLLHRGLCRPLCISEGRCTSVLPPVRVPSSVQHCIPGLETLGSSRSTLFSWVQRTKSTRWH